MREIRTSGSRGRGEPDNSPSMQFYSLTYDATSVRAKRTTIQAKRAE